jgi:hypothetical protein
MPSVTVYVRAKAWLKLVRECKGSELEARRKIAELVHEKYG